jgi:lipopolysaccharide export LptBFGC system permease protein LptF
MCYEMPMPLLIYRYISRRFLSPFLTGMGVFTALLLMDQLSRSVDQLSTQSGNLPGLAWSFVLLSVPLLSYSMPMAFLLGVIGSLETMKQERETTALFAAGFSPLALLPPFLAMGALCCAASLAVNLSLTPLALHAYAGRLTAAARAQFLADLTPGLFFKGIPDTVLLVGSADRETGAMKGVLLVKGKVGDQGQMILAREGVLAFPEGGEPRIDLALFHGALHPVSAPGSSYFSGGFESLSTTIRSTESVVALPRSQALLAATGAELAERMELAEAGNDPASARAVEMERGRRWTSPLSLLLYPFLVVPLALMTGRLGKGAAFAASVLLFIGQFALFYLAAVLGGNGALAPASAPWLPPAVLAAGALAAFIPFAWRYGRAA